MLTKSSHSSLSGVRRNPADAFCSYAVRLAYKALTLHGVSLREGHAKFNCASVIHVHPSSFRIKSHRVNAVARALFLSSLSLLVA
jgi:hypothetical protein